MPMVEITVNGRRHMVQCGEGEEGRVRQLAAYVDRQVADLARGQTQVGDARLLLMASLLVADKLSDAFDEIKQLRATLDGRAEDAERRAAAVVEDVAQQLDAIAAQLERA
jgi:cell division protein ZapA